MKILQCALVLSMGLVVFGGDFKRENDDIYLQFKYKPYSYERFLKNFQLNVDCNRDFFKEMVNFLLEFRVNWTSRITDEDFLAEIRNSSTERNQTTNPGTCCWQFAPLQPREETEKFKTGRVRKEYRKLTSEERQSLHDAFNTIKRNGVFNNFTRWHDRNEAPGAHNGPAFLPWHREYLFRFENALIDAGYIGPGLPYWDSTLDQNLPVPADSVIWSDELLGNLDGPVTSGFAANWRSIPKCQEYGRTLTREGRWTKEGRCMLLDEFDLTYTTTKRCFRDIVRENDDKFESDHDNVHLFVGGHMKRSPCASSDPVFYMHHAFIDCVWERFRQKFQQSNIYTEYPNVDNNDQFPSPNPEVHYWNAPMDPFKGLLNGHGIGPFYERHYRCQRRPIHCKPGQCTQPYLFCYEGRCSSKIREGGDCTDMTDEACYCSRGKPTCAQKRRKGICRCGRRG